MNAPGRGVPSPELLARLTRLGVSVGVPTADLEPAVRPDVTPIESAVPGRSVTGPYGACYVSTARFPGDHLHGTETLARARDATMGPLAVLCRQGEAAGLAVDRAAFLDLETTGLSRGSSTYAFLIGAGRFDGDVFCVRQFFMREPCEEAAQLHAVAEWLADIDGVITFNGRSFDVPVLSCRQSYNGLPAFLEGLPNLDLLPAARRLFGRRLPDCTLGSLERQLLAFEREDDVPGWLVPERYLTYQRTGDARPLVGVFRHNLFDVLSMVAFAGRLAQVVAAPQAVLEHGRDWMGLARVYGHSGDRVREIGAYESALAVGLDGHDTDEAQCRLAQAAKREGDWPRALAVWEAMMAAGAQRLVPFEELAKYYEHRATPPDLERALAVSVLARQRLADGSLRPARGRARGLAEIDHRIARLRRRQAAAGP